MWRYRNPVSVRFGAGVFEALGEAVRGRRYCLVTYGEAGPFDALASRAAALAGAPVAQVRNIGPNPDFVTLAESCRALRGRADSIEAVVAIGGGSVLDAAKVIAAGGDDFARVRACLETGQDAAPLRWLPLIAVPTTAGTGSEVTSWATVWDTGAKKKYSLADERLYPESAIVDPLLTRGVPRAITISSGLDALSHALESIWNVNANPVSTALAETAAREVLETLPRVADNPDDGELRTRMSHSALLAGLAFSNTRTALAHSLSYHLTLHHDTPHGIACSFSLPMVMRGAIGVDRACDEALRRVFGADLEHGARALEAFLRRLGVSTRPNDYGITIDEWDRLVETAFLGDRGRNYIGRRAALGGPAASAAGAG